MKTLLLDGDTFVFSAASTVERPVQWDENLWTLHANLDEAIARLDSQIDAVKERLGSNELVVALSSDGDRWRPKVMPTYKANRKASRKPVVYGPLREYVMEVYRTYLKPTLEGDDVLGILATHPHLIPGEKVVVAIDKDLKTIPGTLYNYGHDTLVEVSEVAADLYFYSQVLTGDATDGYPGCPGVGPKRAEKILSEHLHAEDGWYTTPAEVWEAIVGAYRKAGLSEEVALMNARVARICRSTDYDYTAQAVIPWNPR